MVYLDTSFIAPLVIAEDRRRFSPRDRARTMVPRRYCRWIKVLLRPAGNSSCRWLLDRSSTCMRSHRRSVARRSCTCPRRMGEHGIHASRFCPHRFPGCVFRPLYRRQRSSGSAGTQSRCTRDTCPGLRVLCQDPATSLPAGHMEKRDRCPKTCACRARTMALIETPKNIRPG